MADMTFSFSPPADAKPSRCSGCGQEFVCGAEAGLQRCWCMELPKGVFVPEAGSPCYCPNCLVQRTQVVQAKSLD